MRIYPIQYETMLKPRLKTSSCNLLESLGSELELIVPLAMATGQIKPLYIGM